MAEGQGRQEPMSGTGAAGGGPEPESVLAAPPRTAGSGEDVVSRPPRRRLSPTAALAVVVLLALAFLGGMFVQKHAGASASTGTTFPRPGASGGFFPGGGFGGSGGSGGFGGTGNGFAVGTVSKVHGSTVYITTPNGQTIKVTTSSSTTVRVTKTGAVSDLAAGSTVFVQGTQSGSTIAADTISEGGGFRGGFGPGGGSGSGG